MDDIEVAPISDEMIFEAAFSVFSSIYKVGAGDTLLAVEKAIRWAIEQKNDMQGEVR